MKENTTSRDIANATVAPSHLVPDLNIELTACFHRFQRRPFRLNEPLQMVSAFRRNGYVVALVPLEQTGGYMVFNVGYDKDPMTIHPVALFDREGRPCRFPTRELVRDPSRNFAYMLETQRPLQTRRHVTEAYEAWTKRYVDTTPQPFSRLFGRR